MRIHHSDSGFRPRSYFQHWHPSLGHMHLHPYSSTLMRYLPEVRPLFRCPLLARCFLPLTGSTRFPRCFQRSLEKQHHRHHLMDLMSAGGRMLATTAGYASRHLAGCCCCCHHCHMWGRRHFAVAAGVQHLERLPGPTCWRLPETSRAPPHSRRRNPGLPRCLPEPDSAALPCWPSFVECVA